MQPWPLSLSRTLSSHTEPLQTLKTTSYSPSHRKNDFVFVSMNLTIPGTLYKWNHISLVFLRYASFSISSRFMQNVARIRMPFFLKLNDIILCVHCITLYCTVLYPFIYQWTLELFSPFGYCEKCYYEYWFTNMFEFLL